MGALEELKQWIINSCSHYRGPERVKVFVRELVKRAGSDPDLLTDAAYELVSAYRGKQGTGFRYDGAVVRNATDEEVAVAATYHAGFARGFTVAQIDALAAYGEAHPMPDREFAIRVSQNNTDVIRWTNTLPYSEPECMVVLVSQGVLDRYIAIANQATKCKLSGTNGTNEVILKELMDNDPAPALPILPVGAIPERIITQ